MRLIVTLFTSAQFIIILFAFGIILMVNRQKKIGLANILLGVLIWILSISPTSNLLLSSLESDFYETNVPKGDVIILLGAGIYEDVHDLSGSGFPAEDMLGRLLMFSVCRQKTAHNYPGFQIKCNNFSQLIFQRCPKHVGTQIDRNHLTMK